MSIYQQLKAISDANPHLLTGYRADLTRHDLRALQLSKSGEVYIWILRECGTELFPVAVGMDSVWCTYWLDPKQLGARPVSVTLAYLVTVTADHGTSGIVRPITHDTARAIAKQPAPDGRRVTVHITDGITVTYPRKAA